MITDRIDPPELLTVPGMVNVSVATGTRIVHIAGQTAMDTEGHIAGTTYQEQCTQAFQNLRTALDAAGCTVADLAKVTIYMLDCGDTAVDALLTAASEVLGATRPATAVTMVGVASLWLPELLVEIDAVAIS